MKWRNVLLCVLIALLTLLHKQTELHASDAKPTSQALVTLDQRRADAQIQRDMATLDNLLGDDLTYIHASGLVQDKSEFIADLKSGKRQYKSIKYSDVNVRMLQNAAVITARNDITVTSDGKDNDLSVRITEVYAKRSGRWQLIAYQSTRLTS